MNIFCIVWHNASSARVLATRCVLIVATAIASLASQQIFAREIFISVGYSLNAYDFSDDATDAANATSTGFASETEGKDGPYFFIFGFSRDPHTGRGFGAEAGTLSYQFSNSYIDSNNANLTKKLVGTVSYFNAIYAVTVSDSIVLVGKAGIHYSPSTLSVDSSDPSVAYGEGDDVSLGAGYGAGLLFLPSSSSRFNFFIKFDNFGTVVQNYDNDSASWSSDGKLLSSGDLDLSTLTIAFAYRL